MLPILSIVSCFSLPDRAGEPGHVALYVRVPAPGETGDHLQGLVSTRVVAPVKTVQLLTLQK